MGSDGNILLYPFSLIYGAVTGIRNFLYNTGILPQHEFSIPVICVGNITVGGTGKTPHTEYLIRFTQQAFPGCHIKQRLHEKKQRVQNCLIIR